MNRRLKKQVRRSERLTQRVVERLHGNGFRLHRSTPFSMLDRISWAVEPYAVASFAHRLKIQDAVAYFRAFRQHRQACFLLVGVHLATARRAA